MRQWLTTFRPRQVVAILIFFALAACGPAKPKKVVAPTVYVCTSWKFPGVEHHIRHPDSETDFSGNGFLGFHYYDSITFRDVRTGRLTKISDQDSFACEPKDTPND